jgi:hypothetical protein
MLKVHAAAAAAAAFGHRYTVGQKFGKHIDDSVDIEGQPGHVTGYTLLVYLSGELASSSCWWCLLGWLEDSVYVIVDGLSD